VLVFELMENDLRKLGAEQSKDLRRVSLLLLDSLLDGNCIIVSPLSELTGTLSSPRYMKSVRGHLSPLGSPRDSVKPCGYPTSCHDALRWPKERYQEPVLAAGERTGCVPCNLATQICPSLMGDIQAQFAGEYSIIF